MNTNEKFSPLGPRLEARFPLSKLFRNFLKAFRSGDLLEDRTVISCQADMATFRRRIFNLPNDRLSKHGISVAMSIHVQKGEAMTRIVKEPFAPARRVVKKRASPFERWQAFFAMVNLIFFKGQSS
jgi:hypothetical protein